MSTADPYALPTLPAPEAPLPEEAYRTPDGSPRLHLPTFIRLSPAVAVGDRLSTVPGGEEGRRGSPLLPMPADSGDEE